MIDAWSATVRAAPDAPAFIDATTGQIWTRYEIDREAEAWRAANGESLAGRTVAFGEPNGIGWLRLFLGVLKARGVVIPLDPGEPPAGQQATAAAVGATFLWSQGILNPLAMRDRRSPNDGRCLMKLTSGSTGTPRPLLFTDAQMLSDGRQICAAMDVRPDDRNLGIIPWGHSYGLGNLIMPLLMQGTLIVGGVAPLPHAIATSVTQWGVTVFPAVPALLRAMLESSLSGAELKSVRTVISAGARLEREIAQSFQTKFGLSIHSFYGSSETGGITYDPTGDSAATGCGVGRPLPGVEIETRRGGRFVVKSPAVYSIGNRRRGAHLMPDTGHFDPSGEWVLTGRVGRFEKIAGRRLNIAEVEHAIRQLPGVRDAFVAPHPERADALAAVVAGDAVPNALRDGLRERLASWKIPRKWVVIPEFPVTARGKTDTRRLKEILTRE
jgi:acyl-CoA synthetase (AMP-forming)/AMP-acid ligase II